MSITDASSAVSYDTKIEAGFSHNVVPDLQDWGVVVAGLRDMPEAGELHVTLYLPTHERELRERVLRRLQDFEASYAHTTTVSPTIMHAEDLAEA
jgi:hypothetical protein